MLFMHQQMQGKRLHRRRGIKRQAEMDFAAGDQRIAGRVPAPVPVVADQRRRLRVNGLYGMASS